MSQVFVQDSPALEQYFSKRLAIPTPIQSSYFFEVEDIQAPSAVRTTPIRHGYTLKSVGIRQCRLLLKTALEAWMESVEIQKRIINMKHIDTSCSCPEDELLTDSTPENKGESSRSTDSSLI